MSDTINDVERAQMMLQLGMGESGEPLSADERQVLEAYVAQHGGASEAVQELAAQPISDGEGLLTDEEAAALFSGAQSPQPVEQPVQQATPDLSALVQAEIQKALGGGIVQAAPQSFEDVLKGIDPRDSDAALAMYEWLAANGRFGVVGTLNGGGYLLHYSEPKGTSKAGYTPGATQGGRMVDQAVDKARAAGAKPKEVGMCDKCFSAVEKHESGIVVDDNGNPTCKDGQPHNFAG